LRYFVDQAMLGSEFDGGDDGLEEFCIALQSLTDVKIMPVYSSHNGANNSDNYELVSEALWLEALAIYTSRFI